MTDRPGTSAPAAQQALNDVSLLLWRERELLDLLLFKLEEEQLLLAAGRARWLGRATHEVEVVLEELRHAELTRAVEVDRAAQLIGLPPGPALRALADAAGEPWTTILHDHRDAFLVATAEVSALAETNRDLLSASYRAVRDTLARLAPAEPQTYTPGGQAAVSAGPQLFDRSI